MNLLTINNSANPPGADAFSAGRKSFSMPASMLLGCMMFVWFSHSLSAAPIEMQLKGVSKIWDYAPHNAFPDMVRYQDQWYAAFREANSHAVSGDGVMRVIRSADGVNWESAALLDWNAENEMRDARLTVLDDGRLMLNAAAAPLASTYERQSLCWFTDNGDDWSSTPHLVGEKDWWLWSVTEHPSGDLYGIAYGKLGVNPDPATTTRLYRSEDGINYQTHVSTLTSHPNTNEADLIFLQDGTAVTLVRQNSSGQCVVGTSTGDYTNWNLQTINKSIGGPELIELPDSNIVAATRLYDGVVRTALSWLDPATGTMEELLALPSGGDTSYPGMVWHDDSLWVTYYSSHEGKSNIYLAEVEVGPVAPKPTILIRQHEGAANPLDENWDLFGSGSGIIEGPVVDDPIGGLDAWNIDDASTSGGTLRSYQAVPTAEQMQYAADNGWVFSVNLRVVDSPDAVDASIYFEYAANTNELDRRFPVIFGSDGNGDPIVELYGDRRQTLAGLGDGYHLYELVYDPAAGSADLFVDGVETLSDYEGIDNIGLARIIWGANQSGSIGNGNYNSVYFRNTLQEVLPGDANLDGTVNDSDAMLLATNWQTLSDATWQMGDFNDDGRVDDIDATLLALNWQRSLSGISATVPEPGTIVLLIGLLPYILRRACVRQLN